MSSSGSELLPVSPDQSAIQVSEADQAIAPHLASVMRGYAIFLAQKLDLNTVSQGEVVADDPLTVRAGQSGYAVLFPYGAVVLFGLGPIEEAAFLTQLSSLLIGKFETPKTEEVQLIFDAEKTNRAENGTIWFQKFNVECLQIVADVLAKSVVLDHYEIGTAKGFDQIDPFAEGLRRNTISKKLGNKLLGQLGNTLSIQHKIVGRVEIIDKPDLLWDRPDLDVIYSRLKDEYEISERHTALQQKLDLMSRTAETVLELFQHNTNLRVEWYIVALIVIEILLSLYELFVLK
ncbi:MAG: RMD1 family protein [Elainellaceae cyanobacterium]